jgi:hypothetical protein
MQNYECVLLASPEGVLRDLGFTEAVKGLSIQAEPANSPSVAINLMIFGAR